MIKLSMFRLGLRRIRSSSSRLKGFIYRLVMILLSATARGLSRYQSAQPVNYSRQTRVVGGGLALMDRSLIEMALIDRAMIERGFLDFTPGTSG